MTEYPFERRLGATPLRSGRTEFRVWAPNPDEVRLRVGGEEGATRSTSELAYAPLPEDDPRQRQPDIARARELLGWRPTVSLDEGLRRTVEDFKARV